MVWFYCAGHRATEGVGSLFPPSGFQRLNSGGEAWKQAPLSTELPDSGKKIYLSKSFASFLELANVLLGLSQGTCLLYFIPTAQNRAC